MRPFSRLLLSAIGLAGTCAYGQTAVDAAAYVFEIQGQWRTAPQYAVDLVRGIALRNHDVVELRGEPGRSYIHVGLLDGTVQVRDCRTTPKDCAHPLEISLPNTERTVTGRLREIWNHLTLPDSPSPVFAMSRGAESDEPREAVLALHGGKPDFAPALASMEGGVFDADLTALASGGRATKVSIRWKPPKASATIATVEPGLYNFHLLPEGRAVVVLVSPSDQAAALQADFADAAKVSHGWPDYMAAARHDYLAAVLKQLAGRVSTVR